MAGPRIYADFQNLDDANRLRLTCAGTAADLTRLGLQLRSGLQLTFYTDDADDHGQADELRVDGIVGYDESRREWVAAVDWSSVRHASDDERSGPPRTTWPCQPGSAKDIPHWMAPDFDAPLEDFREYME